MPWRNWCHIICYLLYTKFMNIINKYWILYYNFFSLFSSKELLTCYFLRSRMIFHCVNQIFKPRYTISINVNVTKHHWKKNYLKFHKPVDTFHLLDLDVKIHCYTLITNKLNHNRITAILIIIQRVTRDALKKTLTIWLSNYNCLLWLHLLRKFV